MNKIMTIKHITVSLKHKSNMQKYFSCVNLLSATFSKILVILVLQVQLCLWFCTPTYTEAAKEQLPAAENGTLKFPGLFAFGDSILDTGNNNNLATVAKCNFPPYGRDLVGGIPTGRFGNGKVLSDLIGTYIDHRKTEIQMLW